MRPDRFTAMVCTFALLLGACQPQEQKPAGEEDADDAPAIPVEITRPVRGDIFAVHTATAPIEAFAEADVIAKVDGEVRDVLAEEGQDVTTGQVLARLDGERLRLELNESEARLRKMQRDFDRNRDLKSKGLLSEGDFEKIQYDLEALQAAHNLAQLELDYTRIRAPFAGVVSERFVKVGNMIRAGERLYRVTSLDPLVVYVHVPEREYREIEAGQPVAIDIDALAGERILAAVTRISPVVDPDTGTFKVTIEIHDDARRIKPGMFGRLSIIHDEHTNVLQIPRSAIVEELGVQYVYVVADGKAQRRIVETGYSDAGMVEITAGISDDDAVITVGQAGLKPDARVTVINAPQSEPQIDEEEGKD